MKLRLLSPAIEEIADAALWLDRQTIGLGGEFWRLVDHALSQIAETPLRFGKSEFATSDLDLRFANIERFKYVIHFAIEIDEVVIVAVSHAARQPGYWLRRVKL